MPDPSRSSTSGNKNSTSQRPYTVEKRKSCDVWRSTPKTAGLARDKLKLVSLLFLFPACRALVLPNGDQGSYSASSLSAKTKTLGFLSFDLDDTLFPISPVVDEANQAMIQKMQTEAGCEGATIQEFLDTTRQIRKKLDGPITYSDLRKCAIEHELKRLGNSELGSSVDQSLVEEIFNVWLEKRHQSAEFHLFDDAISMLQEIRQSHPHVCIGAITNGRGNPLDMTNTLGPYFDFCVSGEDEEVFPEGKPSLGIYSKALERYQSHPSFSDSNDCAWFHVGDCLANDILPSSTCGAYSIWYCPDEDVVDSTTTSSPPSWSTATAQDVSQRTALAARGKEKVSAKISGLSELPRAIEQLLKTQPICNQGQ